MILSRLRRLYASRTARSGALFAASGLSFAVANIILSSQLTVESYATFALLVAIIMLTASIGMLGADGIVNRHPMRPEPKLFLRVSFTATAVAVIAAVVAIHTYEIPTRLAALLVPTCVAFTIARFCGAFLQSRMQVVRPLLLMHSLNYLLIVVAVMSMKWNFDDVEIPFGVIAILQSLIAVIAIVLLASRFRAIKSDYVYSWRESLAFVFMASSSVMLVQLDRLITPHVLQLEDLAILGVLLALVGPPFRLLDLALGYDLLPVLRQSKKRAERMKLFLGHGLLAVAMIAPLWALIWFGAPFIQQTFLSSDYQMSKPLILAALVAGTIKAFNGIVEAGVTALASVRNMEIVGAIGWGSIFIGTLAAWYGSSYGLSGVVYGVALGWLLRLCMASVIVAGAIEDTNPIAEETMRLRTLSDVVPDEGR
jgi:hypothetical protein